MQHIAIIGGGITGVTTAYALAKRGLRVTLFERHRYAAMETSFANGGQISASNAEVWNHTSTILKGLKWIGDANAPLLVNPRPSWHKLSWMAEFIANIPHYERNTVATVKLAIAAREHLYSWAQEEGIPFALKRAGILHIYRNKTAFDHATNVNRLLAQGGLSRTAVSPSEMRAIEPTLKGDFVGGYFTESDATGDIHQFTVGLAAAFERLGGTIFYGQQIERIQSNGATVTLTAKGSADTDTSATTSTYSDVVICAGVRSRALAEQLGDRVNIYPVKGYAITVALPDAKSQAAAPNVSLLDDEAKLVTSRLGEDRLRIAGTAEFNGYNLDIRADRIRPLSGLGESVLSRCRHPSGCAMGGIAPHDARYDAQSRSRTAGERLLQHRTRPFGLDAVGGDCLLVGRGNVPSRVGPSRQGESDPTRTPSVNLIYL